MKSLSGYRAVAKCPAAELGRCGTSGIPPNERCTSTCRHRISHAYGYMCESGPACGHRDCNCKTSKILGAWKNMLQMPKLLHKAQLKSPVVKISRKNTTAHLAL